MQQPQSTISLIKASLFAVIIAAITLVLFILPAEYNIDPTGIGQKLGLTVFNEEVSNTPQGKASTGGQEVVVVTVPAGRGVEYKLAMQQYDKVTYEWLTDGGDVYVDLHGELQGDTTGYFESYAIATSPTMKGSFTAPFAGSHGWYWKNNSDKEIQIQLIFSGEFVIEGLK
ncbi:MAG: hypothetical protein ACPG8A_12305 [Psychrobium sp.]